MDPRVMAALAEIGVPFREAEPMSGHTTMGVGGPAAVMAFPRTRDELQRTLALRRELDLPHRVLGNGSNVIVSDEGLDELIVNTRELRGIEIDQHGSLSAEAGANLIRTVLRCCRAGWQGIERAVGIPGSVGGAVVMNAGAHGFSMADVLRELVVFDQDGKRLEPAQGFGFRYRGSSIPDGAAVAWVRMGLHPGDSEELLEETRELTRQRSSRQPGGRSAGCVFKNPSHSAAGQLIDQLGLKGMRRGAAVVSERHANFIVNEGGARADDVLALLDLVRETVARVTGIELELEVKVWRPRS